MKDVLQRLLWLPVPREKKYDSNSLKTKQISLLKLMMRPESLYEKTIDLLRTFQASVLYLNGGGARRF